MVEVRRGSSADAEAVWAVLADGWSLAAWVVGAARVDAVEPGWPAVGTRLRYRIGGWPLQLPGSARVVDVEPARRLALRGDTPFGGVDMVLRLQPGDGGGCVVRMAEDVVSGPAHRVPALLRAAAIAPRNVETLRRLTLLAEAPGP